MATGSAAFAADYTAQIGHLESDKQSRHVHLLKVAEMVKERTNGAVEFQIFPSGQLGNQRQMTEGVQLGTIQGTVSQLPLSAGSIRRFPFWIFRSCCLPMLIMPRSCAKERLGKPLLASFAEKGVVGVALWPNGLKNFTSNKPLDNLDSFTGQKFRVMDSKILIEQFDALGASAIALPFGELYTSLQTGVVDGQENPLDTIQRMKFYEVQKHLVVSEHGAMEDVALFNPAWWNGLPANYRTIITEAFAEVVPELRAHKAKAVDAALDVIKQSDISVRVASADEKAALRAKMYDKAKAAYIERAGATGKDLIAVYEKEYAALN